MGGRPRVVVVDDDESIRLMIATMAPLEGVHVVALLDDAAAAMAWDGWGRVEWAIIDYMMPSAGGDTVVAWLAEHHPHVHCVVLTARVPLPRIGGATVVSKDRFMDALRAVADG